MLKGPDLYTKAVHEPNQHQNLVLAIRMTMNQPLAFENLSQRFQLEIAGWWEAIVLFGFLDLGDVFLRRRKPVRTKRPHAHARLREARRIFLAPIGLLN